MCHPVDFFRNTYLSGEVNIFLRISMACSMLVGWEEGDESNFCSHKIFIRLNSLSLSSMPTRNQNTPSGKYCKVARLKITYER